MQGACRTSALQLVRGCLRPNRNKSTTRTLKVSRYYFYHGLVPGRRTSKSAFMLSHVDGNSACHLHVWAPSCSLGFRYQALWEQQGVPKQNIEILQPPIVDIMIPNRLDAFVEEARIRLQATVEHPLLIHSFSNGGFILSTLLLTSDLRSNMRLSSKLTKYVFDSAPAPLSPDMIARALLSVRYGNIDPLQSSLFFPLRLLCALYLEVPMIKQRHAELWQFWKNEAPVRPILCLLSKTDPLIDVQAANAFLDEQVWSLLCDHSLSMRLC